MLAQKAPLANVLVARPHFAPVRTGRTPRSRRQLVTVKARYGSERGSDRSVLEAFFIGRAFAESVNDKLGAAVGDFLAEIAKADAERRQRWKEFESEIQERAGTAFNKAADSNKTTQKQLPENATVSRTSTNGAVPRTTTNRPIAPVTPRQPRPQASTAQISQLQETVDDLRAELASARFELQQYKASRKPGSG